MELFSVAGTVASNSPEPDGPSCVEAEIAGVPEELPAAKRDAFGNAEPCDAAAPGLGVLELTNPDLSANMAGLLVEALAP